jgi:hypothetical protein
MPSDVDHITDGFPHPTVMPITGVPTYESIAELNLQLNANAASVQSNLGDGLLGLLFLAISVAKYNTLSAVAFIAPVNPGTAAVIPAGATTAQISIRQRMHRDHLTLFCEYLATDKALKQQVIHLPKSIATSEGHMRHEPQGLRSTQPSVNPPKVTATKSKTREPRTRTNWVFMQPITVTPVRSTAIRLVVFQPLLAAATSTS